MIRIAQEIDIPSVCRIVAQMSPGQQHNYAMAVDKFRSHIKNNPDYFLWVAVNDKNEVIGTAIMHLQHKLSYNCGTAAHLEDVVVDINHRKLGIGEQLVNIAIETAKKHDCYKIFLTCFEKTIPYYEKFGFKKHDFGMRMELKELYPK